MSFFSSMLKIMFITASIFPLYSESYIAAFKRHRPSPNCDAYKDQLHVCTREMDPVCATNEKTYSNRCVFCFAMLESKTPFGFKHYGKCK